MRLTRFLDNQARLDIANVISANGEAMLQAKACQHAPASQDLVILDIGANIGEWTLSLFDACAAFGRPNVRVHAFEACRATCAMMEARLDAAHLQDRVAVVRKAVSDHLGAAMLNVFGAGVGINSLHRQYEKETVRVEEVELITIDEYCRQAAIEHVTLAKIDTEGHDLAVIRGASEMLRRHAIDLIQFEYNHRWIEPRSFLKDAFAFLQPLGYHLGKITPRGIECYSRWHPELETFREGNYLAFVEKLRPFFPRIAWWNKDGS